MCVRVGGGRGIGADLYILLTLYGRMVGQGGNGGISTAMLSSKYWWLYSLCYGDVEIVDWLEVLEELS